MDALPPSPHETYLYAPGDIHPRGEREATLCAAASHPDWLYLAGLVALDTGAVWLGSSETIKWNGSVPVRLSGPAMRGLAWGTALSGSWLSLPKCSPNWIGEPPREGDVRANWPFALSLALLAGATAPIVDAIAIGYNVPNYWQTEERIGRLFVAGLAGFAGAFLPYVVPPRTWSAAREIDRIRFGADARGGGFVGYAVRF